MAYSISLLISWTKESVLYGDINSYILPGFFWILILSKEDE